MVLSLRPVRSRQESLLFVFWLLMRPPAALSWLPNPPLPPRRRGESLRETILEEMALKSEMSDCGGGTWPECVEKPREEARERGNEGYLPLIKGNSSDISVVSGTRIERVGKGAKAWIKTLLIVADYKEIAELVSNCFFPHHHKDFLTQCTCPSWFRVDIDHNWSQLLMLGPSLGNSTECPVENPLFEA